MYRSIFLFSIAEVFYTKYIDGKNQVVSGPHRVAPERFSFFSARLPKIFACGKYVNDRDNFFLMKFEIFGNIRKFQMWLSNNYFIALRPPQNWFFGFSQKRHLPVLFWMQCRTHLFHY